MNYRQMAKDIRRERLALWADLYGGNPLGAMVMADGTKYVIAYVKMWDK